MKPLQIISAIGAALNLDIEKIFPEKTKVETKECFRPACKNNRTGNKLYCSAECCKLHKLENKG